MAKTKFNIITSTCVPLPLENVDTDQIIPARFLKATTREEKFFGDNLFRDWRYNADGSLNEEFVLNNPTYGGQVLVAGKKDLYIACADRWLPKNMDKEYPIYKEMFECLYGEEKKEFDFSRMGEEVVQNTSIADYVWLPLRFDGEMVYIDWKDSWSLDEYEDIVR